MNETTPCPPWCQTDHRQYRDHSRLIGNSGSLAVYAYQFGDRPPVVSMVLRRLSLQTIDIDPAQVADVAALIQAAQRTIQDPTP